MALHFSLIILVAVFSCFGTPFFIYYTILAFLVFSFGCFGGALDWLYTLLIDACIFGFKSFLRC